MVSLRILRVALASALLFTSVSGQCTDPKVRREWRSISPQERASWIDAIKCLADLPHDPTIYTTVDPALSKIPPIYPNSSHYDDIVYVHMDLNVRIHGTGFFLPWHRWFIQNFEDELRSKCGYDGVQPYWDWTKDAADFDHATIFSDDSYDGLGSWGDPNNDFQIYTGGFKDMRVAYPVPHNIRRNYTLVPYPVPGVSLPVNTSLMYNTTFTSQAVNALVNSFVGEYISFQGIFESGPHSGPHLILGGEMSGLCPFGMEPPACNPGPTWSPNDPMFFLHHSMVDKVWYDWQNKNSSNKNAFAGGTIGILADPNVSPIEYPNGAPPWLNLSSVVPSDGLWEGDITIGDVMDTVGGKLCYVYA